MTRIASYVLHGAILATALTLLAVPPMRSTGLLYALAWLLFASGAWITVRARQRGYSVRSTVGEIHATAKSQPTPLLTALEMTAWLVGVGTYVFCRLI